jgi:hypothetical protein
MSAEYDENIQHIDLPSRANSAAAGVPPRVDEIDSSSYLDDPLPYALLRSSGTRYASIAWCTAAMGNLNSLESL